MFSPLRVLLDSAIRVEGRENDTSIEVTVILNIYCVLKESVLSLKIDTTEETCFNTNKLIGDANPEIWQLRLFAN
jgi:hypothetical protein